MRTVVFPVFQQQQMAGPTDLGRILVRGWCPVVRYVDDAVASMAIAAAWRIDQTGQQQRLAVFAGQIAVDKRFGSVVTTTTLFNLIDRRYG